MIDEISSEQHLAKNLPFNFTKKNLRQICVLKFAKRCLPFAKFVRQKKLLILCAQESHW